jgi:hypothetical protein
LEEVIWFEDSLGFVSCFDRELVDSLKARLSLDSQIMDI